MLQRSPTYMVSAPDTDRVANFLRKVLPDKTAYAITRWKNIRFQQMVYLRTRTNPDKVKEKLLNMVRKEMGPDYDVDTHFTPHYDPWDQRLCLVPNSDFFESVKSGKASIVTDTIDTFTEKGVLLESGEELDADIIVTATGLELVVLGGAKRRRAAGRLFQNVQLHGHDVFGRTESRYHVRLHQCILDLARRSHSGIFLPDTESHGCGGMSAMHATSAQ